MELLNEFECVKEFGLHHSVLTRSMPWVIIVYKDICVWCEWINEFEKPLNYLNFSFD